MSSCRHPPLIRVHDTPTRRKKWLKLKLGIASGDRIPFTRSPDGKTHWGGAGWVRLGQYVDHLTAQGIEVYIGTLVWNRTHFSIDTLDNEEGQRNLVDVDIVYLQRLMHDTLPDHIQQAKATGQIVLNDLDDWYWGLHPSNKAFESSHPKSNPYENTNHYKKVLNVSTHVTVSTEYLAERLSAFVRCPITILRNTVDVDRFTPVKHEHIIPTVGWVGSTNHRSSDLEQLSGLMKPLYEANEILLMHAGYHYGSPKVAEKWNLPDEAVETLPACDPERYPSLMQMEIGLAPLSDTPFNHAKSDIKLLEYSASGIPWVASDLPSYRRLHEQWGLGHIAKKPRQWLSHIRALKDPNVRTEEGNALREAVRQRDIGVGSRELASFLESLS